MTLHWLQYHWLEYGVYVALAVFAAYCFFLLVVAPLVVFARGGGSRIASGVDGARAGASPADAVRAGGARPAWVLAAAGRITRLPAKVTTSMRDRGMSETTTTEGGGR